MDHDTLKSLTFKPFNLIAMSEVQKRVLGRMPELAGGKTAMSIVNAETPEETAAREEREKHGREDLLVKAKTGTGKTIAFLVPAIDAREYTTEELANAPDEDGVVPTLATAGMNRREIMRSHVGALVISPTRELATQIANEALKLTTWRKERQVQLLVGGGSRMEQLKKFRSIRYGRKDIVVATPGRLVDLLNEPVVREAIANTDMFILDEADTLLDMGFSRDLEQIVNCLPKERQTFLFSATVSPQIQKIAKNFLKPNYSFIDCVPKNESNVHLHVPQYATVLETPSQQIAHLARLVAHDQLVNKNSKVIVFLPTTKQTMLFATLMREFSEHLPQGLSVHEIHSRLDQDRRSRANERFRRDKRASVLVTSDVSARGVDYPGVTRVIQIGIPQNGDQYVHRVGRTGRGGNTGGRGDLILQPFEAGFLNELSKVPIKDLGVQDLVKEIDTLSADRTDARGIANIDQAVADLLPMLDPEAVNDVFMSLLGYYLAKTDILGIQGHDIYAGIQDWSTEGLGLSQPPHVSPGMLTKLGLGGARRNGGGRGGGGFGGGQRKTFGLNRDNAGGSRGNDRGGFGGDRGDRGSYGGNREDRGQSNRGGFGGREDRGGFGGQSNRSFGGNSRDDVRRAGRDFMQRRNDRTDRY